jgi:hypothetical protein
MAIDLIGVATFRFSMMMMSVDNIGAYASTLQPLRFPRINSIQLCLLPSDLLPGTIHFPSRRLEHTNHKFDAPVYHEESITA